MPVSRFITIRATSDADDRSRRSAPGLMLAPVSSRNSLIETSSVLSAPLASNGAGIWLLPK